jgi:2-polyprenyl-3-methyl-5-hydroxy-6-metoxy-1,4-benzoquinol methylase
MIDYYHHVRREIRPLLPEKASRILDVGAGAGATLRWLKTLYPTAETTAVELNPEMRSELNASADIVHIGAVEECLSELDGKTYDLIVLLDVLEHLHDSTSTLQKICMLLEPDGHVIVSVPNVAHLSVSIPLLFRRDFTYREAGILDRTHLRFFVEQTAVKLLNDSNLVVTRGLASGVQGRKARIIDGITFGALRHHLTKQYIMLGKSVRSGVTQGDVPWSFV